MKGAGILVVSFGGVNFGFWSHSQTVKDKQKFRFIAVSRRVAIIYLSLAQRRSHKNRCSLILIPRCSCRYFILLLTVDIDFGKLCENNGLTAESKIRQINTNREKPRCSRDLTLAVDKPDIYHFGFTKGQVTPLSKAISGLRSHDSTSVHDQQHYTRHHYKPWKKKDQGLEEILKKLEDARGLDALKACGHYEKRANEPSSHRLIKSRHFDLQDLNPSHHQLT